MTAVVPQTLKLIYGVAPSRLATVTQLSPMEAYTEAPLYPPVDWFTDEAADAAPRKLTVYPDGRIAGIVAPADRCLLDGTGECWTVPRPADGRGSRLCHPDEDNGDYYIAHQGAATICEDGTEICTGTIAGSGGHANPYHGIGQVKQHYDNPDWQIGRVRYVWSDTAGDGTGGVVVVGATWPEVTERQLAGIRASAASVDYRYIIDESQYRLIGTCLVNVGGLPSRIAAAADEGFVLTPEMLNALVTEVGLPKVAAAGVTFDPARTSSAAVPSVAAPVVIQEDPMSGINTTTPPTAAVPADDTHPAGCTCGTNTDHPAVTAAATDDGGGTASGAPEATATVEDQTTTTAAPTDETPPARTAATILVDASPNAEIPGDPGYDWNIQLSWSGGVGSYSGVYRGWDGTAFVCVIPEVDGVLDYSGTMVIPAAETTPTGKLYDWVNPKDLPDDVVIPATAEILDAIDDAETLRWAIEDASWSYCCSASGDARIPMNRLPVGKATTAADLKIAKMAAAHEEQMAEMRSRLDGVSSTVDASERDRLARELASL